MKPQIRISTISDLESIQKLNQSLCELERKEYDKTTSIDFSLSKNGTEYFSNNINSPDSFVLVAESEGKIIGYLLGAIKEPEDYRTINSLAEADNMFIEETFRGKGIGKEFIRLFEEWCRERKIERIRFVASANNAKAIAVYESCGAEKYNITLEKILK